jgi:type IV secretory pathway VirB2 component (pilin)
MWRRASPRPRARQPRRAGGAQATVGIFEGVVEMPRSISVVLFVAVLIAVVVGVDLLFFRSRFWERLIVNIGIVLVFAAFYLRFLKSP